MRRARLPRLDVVRNPLRIASPLPQAERDSVRDGLFAHSKKHPWSETTHSRGGRLRSWYTRRACDSLKGRSSPIQVGYLTPSDWEPSSMQNNRFRLAI
jgi:hypothetical protein